MEVTRRGISVSHGIGENAVLVVPCQQSIRALGPWKWPWLAASG